MKMNITKSADCKLCDTHTSEGIVLVKEDRHTGALVVALKSLNDFNDKDGYGEKVEFVCNACLQELSGASLIQFVKDDFNLRKEPEDSQILDAMRDLMSEKGFTSTLDVKQALRDENFWIQQDRVHEVMTAHVEDDENDIETINIRYMGYMYYYDSSRTFSTNLNVGSSAYGIQCHSTPVHIYYKLIETIRLVWEISKDEVHASLVHYSYDEIEEILNTGCSQKSWDDFKSLNYELKEIVMENVND